MFPASCQLKLGDRPGVRRFQSFRIARWHNLSSLNFAYESPKIVLQGRPLKIATSRLTKVPLKFVAGRAYLRGPLGIGELGPLRPGGPECRAHRPDKGQFFP